MDEGIPKKLALHSILWHSDGFQPFVGMNGIALQG
jgi:hypothetical protein